jgi:hypothetical protein
MTDARDNWWPLARRLLIPGSGAFWWAVANPPGWALAWLVTSYMISRNVKEQFAIFAASGAVVFGLLTWLLARLFRGTEPEASR